MSEKLEPTLYVFPGFTSPTTTAIPDILFDELLTELSDPQLRVLLYLMRRTFGFKKTSDAVSLNQFTHGITTKDGRILDKGCGIKRRATVIAALQQLETYGFITCTRQKTAKDENIVNVYQIRFQGSTPSEPGVVHLVNQGSTPSEPQVVLPANPQDTVNNKQLTTNSKQEEEEGADAPPLLTHSQEKKSTSLHTLPKDTALTAYQAAWLKKLPPGKGTHTAKTTKEAAAHLYALIPDFAQAAALYDLTCTHRVKRYELLFFERDYIGSLQCHGYAAVCARVQDEVRWRSKKLKQDQPKPTLQEQYEAAGYTPPSAYISEDDDAIPFVPLPRTTRKH